MKKAFKSLAICFILIVGFILFILGNQIGGWRAFIVSSASMSPAINTGALILTHYTHPNNLQKDDIITFIPPIKQRGFVTHRISEVTKTTNLLESRTT